MKDRLVIAIDEPPIGRAPFSALDYIGHLVKSAIARPLVFPSDLKEAASGKHFQFTQDFLELSVKIDCDARSPNQSRLLVKEYAKICQKAARHPYWAVYMRSVKNILVEDDQLLFNFSKPAPFFAALLSSPDFGLVEDTKLLISGGAYRIENTDRKEIRLSPSDSSHGLDLPDVIFQVIRGTNRGLELYDAGAIDVTCNTAFPYEQLGVRSGDDSLVLEASGIVFQLEVRNACHPALMSHSFRLMLFGFLDRQAIKEQAGCQCFYSTETIFPSDASGLLGCPQDGGPLISFNIVLGYFNYYPNRQIALAIKNQWEEKFPCRVSLQEISFTQPYDVSCDVMLALRYPAFPHRVASYTYLAGLPLLDDTLREEIVKATAYTNDADFEKLDLKIVRTATVMPLFEMTAVYLSNGRKVQGFRYSQPYWYERN